ncbi:MAG: hypothetical protein WCH99_14280 [Verrucomicrobiota bacterium]
MEIYNCPTVELSAVLTTGVAIGVPGLITVLPAPPPDGNPPVQFVEFDQSLLTLPFQYTSAWADSDSTAKAAIVVTTNTAIFRFILIFMGISGSGLLATTRCLLQMVQLKIFAFTW